MEHRIRDYGIIPGRMKTGFFNKITDVPGVLVGHKTINEGAHHTGVTVVLPGSGNPFMQKYTASAYVHNGFGKTCGLIQIQELGTLETPIALTNTLNVGLVFDAVVDYMIHLCGQEHYDIRSINPVVGECNDSRINDIRERAVTQRDVLEAINRACTDFTEGDVGAGTGTVCYGLKGGIGSSSRMIPIEGHEYVIGVLVQSNFGAAEDLVINGIPYGARIVDKFRHSSKATYLEKDQGSIMVIIATDLPVSSRQLFRIIRRAGVGIARTGSYTGHGSGEIMIGFSTANRGHPHHSPCRTVQVIEEEFLDPVFAACAESVCEAVLNSMAAAHPALGMHGEVYHSLSEFMEGIG